MATSLHPTKQQVREWMAQRHTDHQPLPDIKQIRRQLGWDLKNRGPARKVDERG
jgi:hypothetical protein